MPVYFIQAGPEGPIKIGVSGHPDSRMELFRTAMWAEPKLLGFINLRGFDATKLERDLHWRFRSAHIRSEWFWPIRELLDYIAANAEAPGEISERSGTSGKIYSICRRHPQMSVGMEKLIGHLISRGISLTNFSTLWLGKSDSYIGTLLKKGKAPSADILVKLNELTELGLTEEDFRPKPVLRAVI